MLTKSGAKLMDFGLARVDLEPGSGSDVTVAENPASPTVASPLTAEGAIVGTFQYMAPEQLEGSEVDRRSDLWALGCVLYEMSTGRRAFEGKTQASLIGSIMHTEPEPVSRISEVSPPELDRLVQACLAKDPDDRIQSAHDVKLQLEWLAQGASSTSGAARAETSDQHSSPRRRGSAPRRGRLHRDRRTRYAPARRRNHDCGIGWRRSVRGGALGHGACLRPRDHQGRSG